MVVAVTRRAKYLIIQLEHGSMLVHLGMSGSLRLTDRALEWRKHDHIEMQLSNGVHIEISRPAALRLPGFGLGAITVSLPDLGPEPLSEDFAVSSVFLVYHGTVK